MPQKNVVPTDDFAFDPLLYSSLYAKALTAPVRTSKGFVTPTRLGGSLTQTLAAVEIQTLCRRKSVIGRTSRRATPTVENLTTLRDPRSHVRRVACR